MIVLSEIMTPEEIEKYNILLHQKYEKEYLKLPNATFGHNFKYMLPYALGMTAGEGMLANGLNFAHDNFQTTDTSLPFALTTTGILGGANLAGAALKAAMTTKQLDKVSELNNKYKPLYK